MKKGKDGRRYRTPEEKAKILASITPEFGIMAVAEKFGISRSVIDSWLRKARDANGSKPVAKAATAEAGAEPTMRSIIREEMRRGVRAMVQTELITIMKQELKGILK